mgnify:CR=1 FL=1
MCEKTRRGTAKAAYCSDSWTEFQSDFWQHTGNFGNEKGPHKEAPSFDINERFALVDIVSQVEPIQLHDLRPGGNEVVDESLVRIVVSVDFSHRPQL